MDRFQFFSQLPRNEPGGVSFTSAYLGAVQVRATDRILDLRCGGGDRSVWVARSRGCEVVCVDEDPRFLSILNKNAYESGAGDKIFGVASRYDTLPFTEDSFPLVIAEWAAVRLGLEQSIKAWRTLVPVSGHIAISYPGVVNRDAPQEVRSALEDRMVEPLSTLADYQETIRSNGYEIVHQTPLLNALWERFYADSLRHAWSTIANGEASPEDPVVTSVIREAEWFHTVGRGRVFLQAMLLRRII